MSDTTHGPMTGAEPGSDGYWFDQSLYDRVTAERGPRFKDSAWAHLYTVGYNDAAFTAARISAERQQVSDEACRRIAAYANAVIGDSYPFRSDEPEDVAEAVRMGKAIHKRATELFPTTLGPAVPVIPEGWDVVHAWGGPRRNDTYAEVTIAQWEHGKAVNHKEGHGSTHAEALTAAIAAAKESEG